MTLVLVLLVMPLSTLSALAYYGDIYLNPDKGEIGDRIDIAGEDFEESYFNSDTDYYFSYVDIYFSRELGVKLEDMNNYGCSLIWGHPQGPTGTRLIIELIEELVLKGGGYGLFDGCAAGDTAAAVVLKVEVK